MDIVDRILSVLQQQKRTQSELAEYLNIRKATISEWKRGRCVPSAAIVGKIADYLNISCDYLILGRETPPPAVNQGIFGDKNHHNAVTIGAGATELSEVEREIITLCGKFTMRQKNALLNCAYKIESENN